MSECKEPEKFPLYIRATQRGKFGKAAFSIKISPGDQVAENDSVPPDEEYTIPKYEKVVRELAGLCFETGYYDLEVHCNGREIHYEIMVN